MHPEFLEELLAKNQVPGAVAGVFKTGADAQAIYSGGVTKLAEGSPAITPGMRFHMGSCGKILTSLQVAVAAAKGMLDPDQTVGHYLPELQKCPCGAATLKEALNHTGGFPPSHFPNVALTLLLTNPLLSPVEHRMVLARNIHTLRGVAAPGKFCYSNAGYAMVGRIFDVLLGQPWEESLMKMVIEPLELKSFGFGSPCADDALQPWGHLEEKDGSTTPQKAPRDNPTALAPAGGMHATIQDVLRFASLFVRGLEFERLGLDQATVNALFIPPAPHDYAGGWRYVKRDWAGGVALYSLGSNTAYTCSLWAAPAKGLVIASMCNKGGKSAGQFSDEAATALLKEVA